MTEREPTVLIVEDDAQLAELYAGWLVDVAQVDVAYTTAEAIDAVDESVDVVFLDRRLPDGSGDHIVKMVRDHQLDCRIAMVTAVEPGFDIVGLGFDDYVMKPVTRDALRSTVDRLLERRHYDDLVQEYFSAVTKRAVLETAKDDATLAAAEEYAALRERISELEAMLEERTERFDDDDYHAMVTTLA